MTGPTDWLLSVRSFQRELRCHYWLEVHASKLFHGFTGELDRHSIRVGLEGVVALGVLRPLRHAPWMPVLLTPDPSYGCAKRRGRVCQSWEYRNSHPIEWFYRVESVP